MEDTATGETPGMTLTFDDRPDDNLICAGSLNKGADQQATQGCPANAS